MTIAMCIVSIILGAFGVVISFYNLAHLPVEPDKIIRTDVEVHERKYPTFQEQAYIKVVNIYESGKTATYKYIPFVNSEGFLDLKLGGVNNSELEWSTDKKVDNNRYKLQGDLIFNDGIKTK